MVTSRKRNERPSVSHGDAAQRYRDTSNYTGASASSSCDDVESRYSRRAQANSKKREELRRSRKRKRIIKRVVIALIAVLVIGIGSAWAYVNVISGRLGAGLDFGARSALVKTDMANKPFYMLLMGTDESADRDGDEEFGGVFRSDTIILARIDAPEQKMTLVSIPRDTQVNLGADYGVQKINAASALGGAELSIKTVSTLAGVDINQFTSVNFDGFQEIVDSLGGIEVEVPMEIDDEDAGGHLDAGLQTLNGEQALILCRARHAYDEFGDGDAYRSANQRLVLSAIASKILSSDVATIATTVDTLSRYVTTSLSVTDIIGLAQAFQGMNIEESLYTGSVPTTSVYEDSLWYEKINEEAWHTMMQRVDQGLPPNEATIVDDTGTVLATAGTNSESSSSSSSASSSTHHFGTVVVRNGSGTAGVATTAADTLQKEGYTVIDVGNADGFDYSQTMIIYSEASRANEAKQIATSIGVGQAQLNDGTYIMSGDFLVVLGSDYK